MSSVENISSSQRPPFMSKSLGEFLSSWTDIDILPKGYRHSYFCISLDIAFPFPANLLISYPFLLFLFIDSPRESSFLFLTFTRHGPILAIVVSLCSSLWPCVVYGQKSYARCSLFSDAEWIAHSEQLCHSSQHPSFPPSHPSVTLHGVQRHHVGLCDRPHMAAAQWQCSLSPQLWHHRLQEHGCHARLRPLGSGTVLGAWGGGGGGSKREHKTITERNNTDLFIPALSTWTNLIALRYLWKTCRTSHVLFWMPTFSRAISASRTCLHRTKKKRARLRICKGLAVRSDLSRGFTSEEQHQWCAVHLVW